MTVGFEAPLPPARTGVADYAVSLMTALRRHGTVEVNSRRAGVRLYHLGNNPLETVCFRIPPGVAEKASLTEHSVVAASLPQTAREIGKRGAWHIHSFHSLECISELYWETLCAYRC